MSQRDYSVLMSVYFKEKSEYLKLAIQSMLNQTVFPDEFILVKDGPLTPELELVINEFVKNYPGLFSIISNKTNLGLGPALAKGVEFAKHDLIARMDTDDFCVNDRIEKQMAILDKYPELGIVGSYEAEFIGNINNVVSIHRVPESNDDIRNFMRRRCAILHPTVIYKKSVVLQNDNYHDVRLYEDYDLFARMIFEGNVKCYNIPETLYYIRTNKDFFDRRGGVDYAKTALLFKWGLYKKKHMSLIDFCISGLGQYIVSMLPNRMRQCFYKNVLRK